MNYVKVNCAYCGKSINKEKKEYNRRIRQGHNKFYCNNTCGALGTNPTSYHEIEAECLNCGESFVTTNNPKEKRKCCSKKCAMKITNQSKTEEHFAKTSKKIKKAWNDGAFDHLIKNPLVKTKCECCKSDFESRSRDKKFCSKKCYKKYKRNEAALKPNGEYKLYRTACAFNFLLRDFPDEFDLDLIKKYGWYRPANRGNNLNGVSRDHIISVKWGFENNIDPKIISHPANCQLKRHNDNVSKYTRNEMTLKELLIKIKLWDKKYIFT